VALQLAQNQHASLMTTIGHSSPQLEKEHLLPPEQQNIGQVFLNMVMPMKVYITYFTNYPQACQRLLELRQNKSGFAEFLEVPLPSSCTALWLCTSDQSSLRLASEDATPPGQ
jgi:hypothetical protein